jgi:hypothetical protein
MPPIPDGTIFMLRDEGDLSVGILPTQITLSYSREIDPAHFSEVLALLDSLAEGEDWHGQVTAFVSYHYYSMMPKTQLVVSNFREKTNPKEPHGTDH